MRLGGGVATLQRVLIKIPPPPTAVCKGLKGGWGGGQTALEHWVVCPNYPIPHLVHHDQRLLYHTEMFYMTLLVKPTCDSQELL